MTDEQIKHMVQRFLAWKLPENLYPDNGISFKPPFDTEPMRSRHWPMGTNFLNATQAEEMVRNMLDHLPTVEQIEATEEDKSVLNKVTLEYNMGDEGEALKLIAQFRIAAEARGMAKTAVGDLPSRLMGWAGKARESGRDAIELDLRTVDRIIAALNGGQHE